MAGPADDPARRTLAAGWGARVAVGPAPDRLLSWGIDPGERSVLAVALQTPHSRAVLDDAAARSCARALGVPIIGTLGLIVRAARAGRIEAAGPVIDQLVLTGLRIDRDLVRRVLDEALGEVWDG